MKPILEDLAIQYKDRLNVSIVSVDDYSQLTSYYKVMAIPTQIGFDSNGKEVFRHVGFWAKDQIISQLEQTRCKVMEGLLSNLGDIVQSQGWLAFPFCFLGGIISSASPCVLAMIPLIIGFVGGYAEGSQKKAIQYSLMFVLGLTITFTILGIIAGALGRLFGDVGTFWYYILPLVAILLGLISTVF